MLTPTINVLARGLEPSANVLAPLLHTTRVCWTAGEASSSKLGAFLVMSQFQGSVNSSAMFLTAAAQNLLCMKLATELGVVIPSPWLTWFKAAVLPAAVGLLITPFLLYKASAWSDGCRGL